MVNRFVSDNPVRSSVVPGAPVILPLVYTPSNALLMYTRKVPPGCQVRFPVVRVPGLARVACGRARGDGATGAWSPTVTGPTTVPAPVRVWLAPRVSPLVVAFSVAPRDTW